MKKVSGAVFAVDVVASRLTQEKIMLNKAKLQIGNVKVALISPRDFQKIQALEVGKDFIINLKKILKIGV
jgi:hypothetical protein